MFKNIKTKEISAIITLFFGLGLTCAGFIVPPTGEVHESVLWILGQTLFYAGSIFGIATHYAAKQKDLEESIRNQFKKLGETK